MAENHQAALIRPYRNRVRDFAAPVALLLILVCAFWKITLTRAEYTWLESPDLAYQVMPWLQYEAAELHRGNLPLWDPHEWAGQNLIGQAQPALVNPLSWPLFAAPLDRGWLRRDVITAWLVFIHFCGGFFCYLLCRDLGRSTTASLFGGTVFALCGWFGTTDWPQMLSGGVWAPLVFLFFFRALELRRPIRNAALSGAMLGVAFLGGHHQIPMFTGLALAGCWIYYLHFDWKAPFRWASVSAFGVMAGLLGAIQILSASAYAKLAVRWVGANEPVRWNEIVPYHVHESLSLPPGSVLGIVIHTITRGADLFLGGAVLLLALAGVALGWKSRPVRVFATIGLGGLLLSFGRWTVFHGIIYSLLPEMNKARNAGFMIFLFAFAAAPLAAFGIDLLPTASARTWRMAGGAMAATGVLFLVLPWLLLQTNLPHTNDYNLVAWYGVPLLLTALALLIASSGRMRNAALPLFAIALLEISPSIGFGYHRDTGSPMLHQLAAHGEIAQWLTRQPGPVRVETDDPEIPYNFSDWYGIDQYASLIPTLTVNVQDMRGNYWGRMLMGVSYWIGRKPLRDNQKLEFTDAKGVNVYRNDDAFPRAWSVHRAIEISKPALDSAFDEGGATLREQAFFVGSRPPDLERCVGDTVDLLKRDPDSIVIDAAMRCKGLVIVGENYDPGWRASIDGRSAPVLEAYSVARAVVVPGGHHRIVMRFRPPSVMLGAVLSGSGALATLFLLVL
jgi:hypothetical protein